MLPPAPGKRRGGRFEQSPALSRIIDGTHRVERTAVENQLVESGCQFRVARALQQNIDQLFLLGPAHPRPDRALVGGQKLGGELDELRLGRIDEGGAETAPPLKPQKLARQHGFSGRS